MTTKTHGDREVRTSRKKEEEEEEEEEEKREREREREREERERERERERESGRGGRGMNVQNRQQAGEKEPSLKVLVKNRINPEKMFLQIEHRHANVQNVSLFLCMPRNRAFLSEYN